LRIAFQKTLHVLHLVDRDDPVAEIVAKQIIQIASTGVRDPAQICEIALKQFDSVAQVRFNKSDDTIAKG
jgi:hypothetical protein